MDTLSTRLEQMRKIWRMTISEVSSSVGVDENIITEWENGTKKPDIDQLNSLCTLYKISSDYLIKGVENLNDKNSINRPLTQEERLADYKEDWKRKLGVELYEKYIDTILVLDKNCHGDKRLKVNNILSYKDFKLFSVLLEQKYIKEEDLKTTSSGTIWDLFIKYLPLSYEFYEYAAKYTDPSTILQFFLQGKIDWNNELILMLLNKGAKVNKVIGTERSYDDTRPIFGDDILATKLLREYCETHKN